LKQRKGKDKPSGVREKILGNSAMSQRYPIAPRYPSILLMASHLSMMAVVQKGKP
jgi:hypothetical protein